MGLLERLFSKRPSREEFAQLVIRALADKGITNARYDPQGFLIVVGNDANTIFLDNSFVLYGKADTQQRAAILKHLIGSFVTSPSVPRVFVAALPSLMPIVRAPSYFGLVDLHLKTRGAEVDTSRFACPKKSLADGLTVVLAYDTEHSIMQVNQETFTGWGVSFDDALAAATDNLREKTATGLFTEVSPGVYRGAWNDSYDSARMLLTDVIYRLPLDGDPVVFVPNRDQLWVAGNRNVAGLKHMLKAGGESHFFTTPSISQSLFTEQQDLVHLSSRGCCFAGAMLGPPATARGSGLRAAARFVEDYLRTGEEGRISCDLHGVPTAGRQPLQHVCMVEWRGFLAAQGGYDYVFYVRAEERPYYRSVGRSVSFSRELNGKTRGIRTGAL